MNNLKNHLLNFIKKHFAGKKKFQRLFNLGRVLSAQGLNYGNGGSIELSGEISLFKYLSGKFIENRPYIIFDVGANEGSYCAELLLHITILNLQIWCFEPSSAAFEKLQYRLSGQTNVHLNNIGFSNQTAQIPLYTIEPGAVTASLFPLERASGVNKKLDDFEIVTIEKLDEFLIANNLQYIDLLKLDIEGNELNALLGASVALSKGMIKAIQFEFGSCNIDSRTYFRDFWNLLSGQYNIYRVIKDGLQPITNYSEYDEIFTTINYYAELKK